MMQLLIWDLEGVAPISNCKVLLWQSYDKGEGLDVISIPELVEVNSDAIRKKYLSWVHDLGEIKINGKRIVDHFQLRPDLSYWWLMPISQKYNTAEESQINDAIKLLLMEELIAEYQIKSITLASSNEKLALTLREYSKKIGAKFTFTKNYQTKKKKPLVRLIYESLPPTLKALILILKYFFRILMRVFEIPSKPIHYGDISFIDVLVHLDKKSIINGEFRSNYWTQLVDKLIDSKIKANWFHIYFHQKSIPSIAKAKHLLKRFNKTSKEMQSHLLIHDNLSFNVFLTSLLDYFRLNILSIRLTRIKHHLSPYGSDLNFWPMFKDEWIASLRGSTAVFQCMELALYEKTFKKIPYQKMGFYIQENQPWELALIYSWRAAGHGELIGIPHTTIRYWDLRYFYDKRSFQRKGSNYLPLPDFVAVNGSAARNSYINAGYPKSEIVEVEALRFLYIANYPQKQKSKLLSPKKINVLICGDNLVSSTTKLLSWINAVVRTSAIQINCVFKSHPAFPIQHENVPLDIIQISDAPFSELFLNCDVVFTSTITSASVDAYCIGIPVIQMLDGCKFNTSPLRGLCGWGWDVKNPNELAEVISNVPNFQAIQIRPYFNLDVNLSRWVNLLNESLKPLGVVQED